MPLKPIYKRAPLLTLQQVPLSCGSVSTDEPFVRTLYDLCSAHSDEIRILEGMFGLSCLLFQNPLEQPAAAKISKLTDEIIKQSISLPETDQLAVMRAAMLMYEYSGDRSLVTNILSWCAQKEAEWDQFISVNAIRQIPADMMELMVRLYRRTGSKGLLRLCARLRSQAMDWSGILRTFDQNRGLKKLIDRDDLKTALTKENGDETAYYTKLYLTNRAVNFADGIRYSIFATQFSGNGQEMIAGERGWEMIKKYHYAVCGGSTADTALQGMGTHRAIDAASTAAWCDSLCRLYQVNSKAGILHDIMDIAINAIPALIAQDAITEYQFVNILKEGAGKERCYDPEEEKDHLIDCLARLSRAIDVLFRTAVTMTENGISINLLLPCTVKTSINNKPLMLQSDGKDIKLKMKESIKGGIFFASANDTDLSVNGNSAFRIVRGSRILLDRIWENGDTLNTVDAEEIGVTEAHHHSVCVKKGNILYAIPANEKKYAYALCGTPTEKDGKVFGLFKKVNDWKQCNGIPNNVPVYPATEENTVEIEMKPYAGLKTRISVFPRGKADS